MAKAFTVLAEVQSKSTGDTYQIRQGGDGVTYCNCKGWIFSKSVPKSCKHLRAYLTDVQINPAGVQAVASAAATVAQKPWMNFQSTAGLGTKVAKAAKPTGLAAVLLDMAKKMERGEQYATSVIVGKMREAADAIQAALPMPVAVTAFQPTLGAVRMIVLDD